MNKSHIDFVGDEANPPLFSCRVEADGRPATAAEANSVFNVMAGSAELPGLVVSGLTFKNLSFSGCNNAVRMRTTNGGSYADITLRDLEITNTYVGLSITALAHGVEVRDCSIARSDIGMQVQTLIGHSTEVEISGNEVAGLGDGQVAKFPGNGIFLDRGDGRVHDNVVTGFNRVVIRAGVGIVVTDDTVGGLIDADVFGNLTDDNTNGIALGGRATAIGRVFDNVIDHSTQWGINVRFGTNGWWVGPNEIYGSGQADVNLTPRFPLMSPTQVVVDPFGAAGNTVVLTPGQTWNDVGSDAEVLAGRAPLNTVIVKDDD